jgi:hypothetical protein
MGERTTLDGKYWIEDNGGYDHQPAWVPMRVDLLAVDALEEQPVIPTMSARTARVRSPIDVISRLGDEDMPAIVSRRDGVLHAAKGSQLAGVVRIPVSEPLIALD